MVCQIKVPEGISKNHPEFTKSLCYQDYILKMGSIILSLLYVDFISKFEI